MGNPENGTLGTVAEKVAAAEPVVSEATTVDATEVGTVDEVLGEAAPNTGAVTQADGVVEDDAAM